MTDGMLAREALERKEKWAFLGGEIGRLMASSPQFRERCMELLLGSGGFLDFETDLRGGLLEGAAQGLSAVLSELDGELEAPSCGRCGSRMHRRGTRSRPAVAVGGSRPGDGLRSVRAGYGGDDLTSAAGGFAQPPRLTILPG